MNLTKHLPKYYSKSVVMAAVLLPPQNELQRISEQIEETERQLFINEATTALTRYEKDLGIITNNNEAYDIRRSRILSKLRGLGTVTNAMLINVVKSYIDGIVKIIETPNEYKIGIKFISKKGVPTGVSDVQRAVSAIIPAHLYVEYIYTYRTWDDVLTFIETWNAVRGHTWEGLSTMEIIQNLNIVSGYVFYRPTNDGNATLVFDDDGKPYARSYEGE